MKRRLHNNNKKWQIYLWIFSNYYDSIITILPCHVPILTYQIETQQLSGFVRGFNAFVCIFPSCYGFTSLLIVDDAVCLREKKNMSNDPTHSIDAKFHNSGLWIFCNNRRFMSLCWVWQEIAYPELWKSFWMTTTMSTMASVHFDFQPKHPSNKFCNNNLWIFYANK